jgi:hypothetical protein
MPHLDNMQVAPFNNTFDRLAIIEHKDHKCLRLHLLLEVKQFSVAAVLLIRGDAGVLMGEQRRRLTARLLSAAGGSIRQPGANKFARAGTRRRMGLGYVQGGSADWVGHVYHSDSMDATSQGFTKKS